MAKRRRSRGLGDAGGPESWFRSARTNFDAIRKRHSRVGACGLVEHYTDVIAEATVASVLAAKGSVTQEHADKLAKTATRAQRGAVAACRRGR